MSPRPQRRFRAAGPGARGSVAGGLIALALGGLLAVGCGRAQPEVPAASPPPERIVALAPNLAEIVFALGLGERVVGVGSFCHWPPEARTKPRLGGLTDPNLELLVTLDPQLAVLLPSEDDVARQLERLGVEVLTVRADTLAQIEAAIVAVAERCGVPAAGEELVLRWRAGLAPEPVAPGARVLLTVGRPAGRPAEVLVAGPGTFLDELLARLGAANVFADAPLPYPTVGLEEILRRDPDVIVELHAEPLEAAAAAQRSDDWRVVPGVGAVRNGRVVQISGDFTVIPGPRLPRLYAELAAALEGAAGEGDGTTP